MLSNILHVQNQRIKLFIKRREINEKNFFLKWFPEPLWKSHLKKTNFEIKAPFTNNWISVCSMYASTYVSDCICHKCIYIQFNLGLDGRKPEADILWMFVESLDQQGAFFKLFSTNRGSWDMTYILTSPGFSTFSRVKLLCLFIDRINLDSNVITKRDHFQNAVLSLMQLLWQSLVFDYEICQYRLKWSILYLLLITWGITVALKVLYAKILCKMQVSTLWTLSVELG